MEKLIKAVIDNQNKIPYINLNELNAYTGWTADFHISVCGKESIRLNLEEEEDLFLLFVLASAWSKTGPWENAAYFTVYLKASNKDKVELWLDEAFVEEEKQKRKNAASEIVSQCTGVIPRKKISFRQDYYTSMVVLAKEWEHIKAQLYQAEKNKEYDTFIQYISSVSGLGAGRNKMRIKIPLILRELRCQNVFQHIPGKYCCVPDERVKVTCKELGIYLPAINSIKNILKASEIIYDHFGDLYDIPLFAYEDLKENI